MHSFDFTMVEDGLFCLTGYEGDEAEVVLPDVIGSSGKLIIINDDVFKGHSEITSIHFPDTVTDMGEFVFDGCSGLKTIRLPESLENLWGHTFANSSIEEITLPDGLKSIPCFAFKNCRELKKIVCGAGLKKIYAGAFAGCEKLTEISHGPNVDISPKAFEEKI